MSAHRDPRDPAPPAHGRPRTRPARPPLRRLAIDRLASTVVAPAWGSRPPCSSQAAASRRSWRGRRRDGTPAGIVLSEVHRASPRHFFTPRWRPGCAWCTTGTVRPVQGGSGAAPARSCWAWRGCPPSASASTTLAWTAVGGAAASAAAGATTWRSPIVVDVSPVIEVADTAVDEGPRPHRQPHRDAFVSRRPSSRLQPQRRRHFASAAGRCRPTSQDPRPLLPAAAPRAIPSPLQVQPAPIPAPAAARPRRSSGRRRRQPPPAHRAPHRRPRSQARR